MFYRHTKGVSDRVKHMATLKKMGSDLSAHLAEIPEVPNLLELRTNDEAELSRVLCLMIISLIEYHDTSKIMSNSMIEEVATRIAYKFGGLTLEDIALCFHQVKNGQRGKVYNRIDAAVVMEWVNDYEKDVQEIGMERERRLHGQGKTGGWKNYTDHRLVVPTRLRKLM